MLHFTELHFERPLLSVELAHGRQPVSLSTGCARRFTVIYERLLCTATGVLRVTGQGNCMTRYCAHQAHAKPERTSRAEGPSDNEVLYYPRGAEGALSERVGTWARGPEPPGFHGLSPPSWGE